jgi:hypothetical protein
MKLSRRSLSFVSVPQRSMLHSKGNRVPDTVLNFTMKM